MITRQKEHLSTGAVITFPHKVTDTWEALTIVKSLSGRFSVMQNITESDRDILAMVGKTITAAGEGERHLSRSETSRGYNTEITGKFWYKCVGGEMAHFNY
jgi:hypothetical protein